MDAKRGGIRTLVLTALTAMALYGLSTAARAQVSESDVPETSIVPESESTPPPSRPKRVQAPATSHHEASTSAKVDVEPAHARVKLVSDTPVLTGPAKSDKTIETAHAGKFIDVTGSTRYFLQVKLKSGQTGYIDPAAVALVKPTDKIFALTTDAAVLDKPNRWAKKVSEVHKGHNVHVIGIALNYTKIKMKSGLEGYIPMSALE